MANDEPIKVQDVLKALLQAVKTNAISIGVHDQAIQNLQVKNEDLQQQINDLTRKLYQAGVLKNKGDKNEKRKS